MSVPIQHAAENVEDLAGMIGKTSRTLRRWRLESDFPVTGLGPFTVEDVVNIKRWIDGRFGQTAAPDDSDTPALAESKRRIAEEDAKMRRLKRLRLEGKLVDRERLEAGERALIAHVCNRLEEMVEALPADICPDDPCLARAVLRDWVDRFREDTAAMRFFAVPSEDPLNGRGANPTKRKAAVKRHHGRK